MFGKMGKPAIKNQTLLYGMEAVKIGEKYRKEKGLMAKQVSISVQNIAETRIGVHTFSSISKMISVIFLSQGANSIIMRFGNTINWVKSFTKTL